MTCDLSFLPACKIGPKIGQNIEEALRLCLNTVQALVRGPGGRGYSATLYGEAPPRGPTLAGSLDRWIWDRWIARSLDRWISGSLDRSIGGSGIAGSPDRWIGGLMDRWFA